MPVSPRKPARASLNTARGQLANMAQPVTRPQPVTAAAVPAQAPNITNMAGPFLPPTAQQPVAPLSIDSFPNERPMTDYAASMAPGVATNYPAPMDAGMATNPLAGMPSSSMGIGGLLSYLGQSPTQPQQPALQTFAAGNVGQPGEAVQRPFGEGFLPPTGANERLPATLPNPTPVFGGFGVFQGEQSDQRAVQRPFISFPSLINQQGVPQQGSPQGVQQGVQQSAGQIAGAMSPGGKLF